MYTVGMDDTNWLSESQLQTWTNFLAASQLIEERVDSQLRSDFNFTHSEFEILVRLAQAKDNTIRMGELARLTIINKSALTYKVNNLSKKGFIKKSQCKVDARGLEVTLTDKGKLFLADISPSHVETVRKILIEHLSDAELVALNDISKKLLTQFSTIPPCQYATKEISYDGN